MTSNNTDAELKRKLYEVTGIPTPEYAKSVRVTKYTLPAERFDLFINDLIDFVLADRQQTEKQTAKKIFELAHEYARKDKTMVGFEELRDYHYYNAIYEIGGFDGR